MTQTPETRAAGRRSAAAQLANAYGMLAVLALLCAFFALATYHDENPTGAAAGTALAAGLKGRTGVIIVQSQDSEGETFARSLEEALSKAGTPARGTLSGDPPTVRAALERLAASEPLGVVATTRACADWTLFEALKAEGGAYAGLEVIAPRPVRGSTFLSASNLRNIADQISVIAIMAVGMTLVIITGGIDLSVGSLLAFGSVTAAWMIAHMGGVAAGPGALILASVATILLCGLVGSVNGAMVTLFKVPPFISSLAMMQVTSGLAFIVSGGLSIFDIPKSFVWLGRGADLGGIPNAVALMALIYVAAHIVMSQTRIGRNIYALGGNFEAARLSGISTRKVLMLVYSISGIMAGVGGVITTSQLRAGSATYGAMYELYVIAAVVVGGASLSGGEGRIFGTLIGALIIGVIRNGMNLMDVEPYLQKVVLGLVILGAVLLDMLKRKRWSKAGA